MNRRHSADDYRRTVERLRRARPGHRALVRLHRRLSGRERSAISGRRSRWSRRSASPRPSRSSTARGRAPRRRHARPGQGPGQDRAPGRAAGPARARRARLSSDATVGRTLPVLLERPGRHPGQLVGRTPYLQPVHVAAPDAAPGDLIEVLITASHAHSLAAAPVAGAAVVPRDPPRGQSGMRLKPVPTLAANARIPHLALRRQRALRPAVRPASRAPGADRAADSGDASRRAATWSRSTASRARSRRRASFCRTSIAGSNPAWTSTAARSRRRRAWSAAARRGGSASPATTC